jgi:hypothetical protein
MTPPWARASSCFRAITLPQVLTSRGALLRLLVLLSDEPEIVELEAERKRTEPRHSMLRLLNSSAFRLA